MPDFAHAYIRTYMDFAVLHTMIIRALRLVSWLYIYYEKIDRALRHREAVPDGSHTAVVHYLCILESLRYVQ